jgi:hypothetical protein
VTFTLFTVVNAVCCMATRFGIPVAGINRRYGNVMPSIAGIGACETLSLRIEAIQEAFVYAFNQIIDNKYEIIHICEATLVKCCDIRKLSEEYSELQAELEIITGLKQQHISTNAQTVLDQVEYRKQYNEYAAWYTETKDRIVEVQEQQEALTAKQGQIRSYLDALAKQSLMASAKASRESGCPVIIHGARASLPTSKRRRYTGNGLRPGNKPAKQCFHTLRIFTTHAGFKSG